MAKTTINDLIKKQMQSSKQMGDIEFQMGVSPYMPKGAKIDPSKFRLHRLPESMRELGLNKKGFSVSEDSREGATLALPRGYGSVPADPGTVNVLGVVNSTNRLIGHEYRHQEGLKSERVSRIVDLMTSQNQADLDNALYFLHDLEYQNFMRKFSFAEPEERASLQKEWKEVTNLYEGKGSKEDLKNRIKKSFGNTIKNIHFSDKGIQPSPFFKDLMGIKPTKEEKKSAKRMDKIIAKQKQSMKKSLLDAQKFERKGASLLPDAF